MFQVILPFHARFLAVPLLVFAAPAAETSRIEWHEFSPATVAKAREEKKLLFLDVEAVWCHWCHVMDKKTYSDPRVQEALGRDFICAKLDQDSRPDLARRYEEYGWPALVIIDPATMAERNIATGFQEPDEFLEVLRKGREAGAKSGPEKSADSSGAGQLSTEQKASLLGKIRDRYNPQVKGWGSGSKFVPWQNVEFCLRLAVEGDSDARQMALDTLTAGRRLIDPVWGGVYQYSTDDDWEHPHFEKIMEFQAEITRAYSLAYLACGRPEDLKAAQDIGCFLHGTLLSPEGAFYVSQDADVVQGVHSAAYFSKDDAGRRAAGIPRIDKHLYSRENGLAISALVALWQASGEAGHLDAAERAANWIVDHRSLPGGGFSHDEADANGPFLGDQIYMGRATLALYLATADHKWLDRSAACADFMAQRFIRPEDAGAGFSSGIARPDLPSPVVDRDENIEAARWLNLLAKATREERFAKAAHHAMLFLSRAEVGEDIFSFSGGLLLADRELSEEPVHLSIVGKKDDPATRALFLAAQKHPSPYKLVERVSAGETTDIPFPDTGRAAAFLCTKNTCSSPKFTPLELIQSFSKK